MAALNFGLLNTNAPAEIAGSVDRGRTQALQEKTLGLQHQSALLQQEQTQMQIEQAKRERASLQQLQQSFIANGKSPDLRTNFTQMMQSGIPHFMDIGIKGLQALDRQDRVAKILGGAGDAPAVAAPAPTNALAGEMPAAAPVANALKPAAPYTPVMPQRNALAAPAAPVAAPTAAGDLADTYRKIDQLHAIGEHELAKSLEQRVKDKLPPSEVQQYEYAKTPAGGGFKGTFAEFKTLHAPRTTVNVDNKGPSKYAETVNAEQAKSDIEMAGAAEAAARSLPKLTETLKQLRTSDAITGIGADVMKNLARVQSQFLADRKAGKQVTDTEYLDALLGSDVFPMIQSLGIGARGMDTPAERDFLRQVMTGSISMNKDTLVKLTEMRANIAKRAVQQYNDRVQSGELDEFFSARRRPKKTIPLPPEDGPAVDPATVTLPNGQVIRFPDATAAQKFKRDAGL